MHAPHFDSEQNTLVLSRSKCAADLCPQRLMISSFPGVLKSVLGFRFSMSALAIGRLSTSTTSPVFVVGLKSVTYAGVPLRPEIELDGGRGYAGGKVGVHGS